VLADSSLQCNRTFTYIASGRINLSHMLRHRE
jgi:hypothetical protein